MLRASTVANETAAQKTGRFSSGPSDSFIPGVSPLTRPTSSASDLGFVTRLMPIVRTKQIIQAQIACHRLRVISLGLSEKVMTLARLGEINLSLKPKKIENDEIMPAIRPQNAPVLLVRRQNMPRSMVANNGALTQLKMA